jgi:hypothetical protein
LSAASSASSSIRDSRSKISSSASAQMLRLHQNSCA